MATTNASKIPASVRSFLKRIGKAGGKKSKRKLSKETSRQMIAIRLANAAFKKHYHECFWSFPLSFRSNAKNIALVINALKKEGNHITYNKARKIEEHLYSEKL